MKKLLLFCFVFLLATFLVSAQVSFESLEMGKSSKNWKNTENVSNPNSWEETAFILKDKVNFLGKEISDVKLEFYNDRLFRIGLELPAQDWEKLKAYLEKQYGKPWRIDEAKKEAAWGSTQKGFYTSANNNSILIYSADDSQKEFHWQDLFRGVLLYVILAIVGLFLVYFIIAWLLASYCPKCHSFSMELQEGVEFSNPTDYSGIGKSIGENIQQGLLGSQPEIYYDKTYKYKCKKCGHRKKEKYSGFWQRYTDSNR